MSASSLHRESTESDIVNITCMCGLAHSCITLIRAIFVRSPVAIIVVLVLLS